MNRKLAIFISGYGSNLKAVLDQYPKRKPFIYSNKICSGLSWAKRRGCSTSVKKLKKPSDWSEFASELNTLQIEEILLLGFMKIIPAIFLSEFQGKLVNLHPSLLPLYPGLDSITKAYNDGADLGASLHIVTEGVDEGPIIIQKKAIKNMNLENSKQNVHVVEQKLVCNYLHSL